MSLLWKEIDICFEEDCECPRDSMRYQKKLETEHVFEFLAGLKRELDEVCGRVLSQQLLPLDLKVFLEVRWEDHWCCMMLGEPSPLSSQSSLGSIRSDYGRSTLKVGLYELNGLDKVGRWFSKHHAASMILLQHLRENFLDR